MQKTEGGTYKMILERIDFSNIDFLIKTICAGRTSKDHRKDLGPHINNIYNHVEVKFLLRDVDIVTACYLKKFSNDNIIFIDSKLSDNLVKKDYKELYNNTHVAIKLIEAICKDNDSIKRDYSELFPAICITKSLHVTFTGSSLGFLFGSNPDLMLKELYSFKEDSDFNSDVIMENDYEKLKNHLFNTLLQSIYKFIDRDNHTMDLLADSSINFHYYNIDDLINYPCCLIETNSPLGRKSYYYKENVNKDKIPASVFDKIALLKNTKLVFSIKAPYYAYLEMQMALPSRFFLDSEDVRSVAAKEDYNGNHMILDDKYKIRLTDYFIKLASSSKELIKNEKALDKYFYIPLTSNIHFTMNISLYDIANELEIYEEKIESQKLYGDSDNYLSSHILDIIFYMKSFSRMVYKDYFN